MHLVLLECLVIEPSSYPCDVNFEHRVQELINTGTVKGQYSRLSDMRWQDQALKDTTKRNNSSSAQMDPTKNRNLNIVPGEYNYLYFFPCQHFMGFGLSHIPFIIIPLAPIFSNFSNSSFILDLVLSQNIEDSYHLGRKQSRGFTFNVHV